MELYLSVLHMATWRAEGHLRLPVMYILWHYFYRRVNVDGNFIAPYYWRVGCCKGKIVSVDAMKAYGRLEV